MVVMGFGLGIATVARTVVVLTAPPPGLTGLAAGINSAAGQSGFTLGIILSSMLVTRFASQHFIDKLKQTNAPQAVIVAATKAFQDLFSVAFSIDYANLPRSIEPVFAKLFGEAFTQGLGQTYLVFGIATVVAGVAVFLGMSKGLKASLAVPMNQINQTGSASSPTPVQVEPTEGSQV